VHKRLLDIRKDTNTAAECRYICIYTLPCRVFLCNFWLCCCLMQPTLLLLLLVQFANICYKVNSLNEKCEQKKQIIYTVCHL